MNGRGIYHFPNRTIYEGKWSENKMHGYGIIKYTDGKQENCTHTNGKKNGKCTVTYPDGRTTTHNYVNGKIV